MNAKKIIRLIHLWLGLLSGLVVLVVAVTGALFVFERELGDLTQGYRFVEKQDKEFLLPSVLKKKAEKLLSGKQADQVHYDKPGRSAFVRFFKKEHYYFKVYINPYSGEILEVKNMNRDFFYLVMKLHYSLLLPGKVGEYIVDTATLIFMIMLVSGIILWWPRNNTGKKSSFRVKWSASPKRLNYDLHSVLGFYVCWLGIISAISGSVWGFEWFARSVYKVASIGDIKPGTEIPKSTIINNAVAAPASMTDKAYLLIRTMQPGKESYTVTLPQSLTDCIGVITNPDYSTYYKRDYFYFDRYSLKPLTRGIFGVYETAGSADKLTRMNYDIHVGAILGLPGKILAFCTALLIASLPVTGLRIWWGRKYKRKNSSLAIRA